MKRIISYMVALAAIIAGVYCFNSCEDLEGSEPTQIQERAPVITTSSFTNVTSTSATLGGNISDPGVPPYTERGICYSTSSTPTTSNNKTRVSGSGTGSFSTNVTGLTPSTTYYVRAYVITPAGTFYGNQMIAGTTSSSGSSGSSGNSGNSGNSGSSGSDNCVWVVNDPSLSVNVKKGAVCGADSYQWFVTNNSREELRVYICYERRDGTWMQFPNAPGALKPGDTYEWFTCSATGRYTLYSIPYSRHLICNPNLPRCNSSSGGNTGGNTGTSRGTITVWIDKDHGCGPITVTVAGVGSKTITQYFTSGTANCGDNGAVNFPDLPYGTYSVSAQCSGYSWPATNRTLSGPCYTLKLN